MASVLIFTLLTTYFCLADGQASCSSPSGGTGTCISLYDCPSMLDIVKQKDKRPQSDLDLLKKSHCGFQGETPKVCCPKLCYTPEGQPGECVNVFTCVHLANKLKPPLSRENQLHVQKFVCNGTQQYSVCCGLREETVALPMDKCAATVTAFPPDPRTECCGLDDNIFYNKLTTVGGVTASVGQYPWLVIIEYYQLGKMKLLCGGALISGRYVMTAGHCVVGAVLKIGKPTNVRLGEHDISHEGSDCSISFGEEECNDGMILVPIELIIPHPDYNTALKFSPNDIALIRLKETAPYTYFIRPICLPRTDVTLDPPVNFTTYVAGWGAVSQTQLYSNVKQHVDLPYVARDICEQSHKLTASQICAGGVPGKDSCKGDSGGPLMGWKGRTFVALGVVSFGPKHCGLPDVPGVYTKVYAYIDWIRNTIVA